MLDVRDINVDIGTIPILRGGCLALETGQMVGLIGRNGAGKTTFLRTVMGMVEAKSGEIDFDHTKLLKIGAQQRAHLGIGYMPEDRRVIPQLSARDNICLPVLSIGIPDWENRLRWIHELIPEVEEFEDRATSSLSGGQQKLVALARALMIGQKLLLLDEPTEGVAPVLARRISSILSDLKREGVSVLVAESNAQHCADLLDRMYVIERGLITENADLAAVLH